MDIIKIYEMISLDPKKYLPLILISVLVSFLFSTVFWGYKVWVMHKSKSSLATELEKIKHNNNSEIETLKESLKKKTFIFEKKSSAYIDLMDEVDNFNAVSFSSLQKLGDLMMGFCESMEISRGEHTKNSIDYTIKFNSLAQEEVKKIQELRMKLFANTNKIKVLGSDGVNSLLEEMSEALDEQYHYLMVSIDYISKHAWEIYEGKVNGMNLDFEVKKDIATIRSDIIKLCRHELDID
ncbi:hypothetical protein NFG91_003291 [Salmonella enterica]|nr:hypothetical protein [Salmonella enterica subsp. enterica serovar Durham]EJI2509240.1 hypothetical protein [Salmonella enterica]ECD6365789.1 hypothetical protein [Salmonella enterica subsp. enterica serovar Durham]EDA3351791.1 hypothetical protein [Salmonella enterica subsp. enterica serovar Durham]EIN0699896.1 hypothetical protein [Salmonella enterica subsp. enterica serovar Durham]